jgi:hypothetical protein
MSPEVGDDAPSSLSVFLYQFLFVLQYGANRSRKCRTGPPKSGMWLCWWHGIAREDTAMYSNVDILSRAKKNWSSSKYNWKNTVYMKSAAKS